MSQRFHHERLLALRLDFGYSQEALAEAIGVDVTTYRHFESGRVNRGRGGFRVRTVRRQNILLAMAEALELEGPESLILKEDTHGMEEDRGRLEFLYVLLVSLMGRRR